MSKPADFAALPAAIEYAIGIDGGGTSTRARVVHRSGVVVGDGKAGASGLSQGIAQAWRHIGQAITAATTGQLQTGWAPPTPANCALGLGLAGANNPDWNRACIAANPGYAKLVLESDAFTAVLGAHRGQAGALVIMGTGAIGLAVLADGRRRVSGGWGFPCGDEGSGADLGLQAIGMTQRAVDERTTHGPLTRAIYALTGGTPQDLLAWCGSAGQYEYATLAPLIFAHESSDPLAAALIVRALDNMALLVRAVDPEHALPLVVAGSIGQRLAQRLPPALAATAVTAQGDAVDGALALCFI